MVLKTTGLFRPTAFDDLKELEGGWTRARHPDAGNWIGKSQGAKVKFAVRT